MTEDEEERSNDDQDMDGDIKMEEKLEVIDQWSLIFLQGFFRNSLFFIEIRSNQIISIAKTHFQHSLEPKV